MDKIDVWKLELHALRILVLIHELGTFTAVAERLELNQSTVSYTVDRLRQIFGDELFVRQGRGIAPTARCSELANQARSLLRLYEEMTKPADFDPQQFDGRFIISCNPYEECVLMPSIWNTLTRAAPLAQISIIRTRSQGEHQLLEGQADVLISPQNLQDSGLQRRWLFADRYVCFCFGSLDTARLSWDAYQAASHIRLRYDESWFPLYRDMLRKRGLRLDTALELPGLSSLATILGQYGRTRHQEQRQATELVFTAPERLSDYLGVGYHKAQAPFDCSFDAYLYWPSREQTSPRNRWLRERVVEAVKSLLAPELES